MDVRNPLLSLPAAQAIQDLSQPAREALGDLLGQLSRDAAERAEKAWKKSKGPMAAYWKAVSVYAKHTRKLCR
jgi:hypothetical protein